jgi:hypothetical protein
MSDTPTAAPSASSEPATGRVAENAAAGFREMPPNQPPARKEKEFSTAREAGADLANRRAVDTWGQPKVETVPVEYRTPKGDKAPANAAISLERAADDLKAWRDAQENQVELGAAVEFDRDVDLNRFAEGLGANPEAQPNQPQLEQQPQIEQAATPGVDPRVSEALKHPQVREAIQAEVTKAQETQTQYSKAVQNAYNASLVFFGHAYPEFQNMTAEQVVPAMQQLAQTNPQRFQQAVGALQAAAKVETAMIADQKRQHEVHNKWLNEQNQIFERSIANRTPQQRAAIGQETVAYAAELGVNKATLIDALQKNPVLRSAVIQRMIVDAVEARLARKEVAKQRAKAAPVPHVQKPGNSGNRGIERGQADLAALNKRISDSRTVDGSLRAAAALLSAKRNRGR